MQLHSARTFQPRPAPKDAIPYTSAALRQDLERLRGVWDDCQASRFRNSPAETHDFPQLDVIFIAFQTAFSRSPFWFSLVVPSVC
jgi:hypothetical protein